MHVAHTYTAVAPNPAPQLDKTTHNHAAFHALPLTRNTATQQQGKCFSKPGTKPVLSCRGRVTGWPQRMQPGTQARMPPQARQLQAYRTSVGVVYLWKLVLRPVNGGSRPSRVQGPNPA